MKLHGKKAIDKLFEGEWEGVCYVLWNPAKVEWDLWTERYFRRRIEHAIWMAQNIEMLRGGRPSFYWFNKGDGPAEFWEQHDKHLAIPYKPPETIKYDRMVKKRAELDKLEKLKL